MRVPLIWALGVLIWLLGLGWFASKIRGHLNPIQLVEQLEPEKGERSPTRADVVGRFAEELREAPPKFRKAGSRLPED